MRAVPTFNPVLWPAALSGVAAVAAAQEREEREATLIADSDSEREHAEKRPRQVNVNKKTIVSGGRQGRAAATPVDRDATPVTPAADNARTPKGLATGVNVSISSAKERAQAKSEIEQLRRQLTAKTAAADRLQKQVNQERAASDRFAASLKEQISSLTHRLQSEGQRAFDQGYQQGFRVVQVRPAPVARLVPTTPAAAPASDLQAALAALTAALNVTTAANGKRREFSYSRGCSGGKHKKAKQQAAAGQAAPPAKPN